MSDDREAEEFSDYAFGSLKDECYGDQAVADLLLDDNAHPEAKKFFAQRVSDQRNREKQMVEDAVKRTVDKNSPFYRPEREDSYRERGAIVEASKDD